MFGNTIQGIIPKYVALHRKLSRMQTGGRVDSKKEKKLLDMHQRTNRIKTHVLSGIVKAADSTRVEKPAMLTGVLEADDATQLGEPVSSIVQTELVIMNGTSIKVCPFNSSHNPDICLDTST